MLKDITLGQYFPGNTPVHRLDPRTKLLGMLAYIIVIFFVKKITIFLLPALFVAMVTYLARVPLSYLVRSLKPIRFLLVFMFFINLFMVKTGDLIWEWRFIQITEGGVYQAPGAAACGYVAYDAHDNTHCAYGRIGKTAHAVWKTRLSGA